MKWRQAVYQINTSKERMLKELSGNYKELSKNYSCIIKDIGTI